MANKTVRLIDIRGVYVADADIRSEPQAIVYSNSVYVSAFRQGTIDYFREISAERVREIKVLSHPDSSIINERKDNATD